MKKTLITGVAGFIGFYAAKRELEKGNYVIGVDNLNNYYEPKIKKDRLNILKKEKNFNSIVGHFKITDNRGDIFDLKPELRVYNQPIIITSEADIKTTLLKDNFLVMNTVKGNEYFNIRYQVKPFMLWIWISVLLISLGGMISFLRAKNEK